MRHAELPIVSFISILLLLCSLPSHIRAGSVCTIALIAWLSVMSLIRGVNALIWAENYEIKLEVWCDIATKITLGFTYAVPAAALCVLRHLENVASTRHTQTTKADKRRRQIFEVCMCFGLPIFFMALHYVVQGHRYDLFEDFGCYPAVYFSIPAILIVYVPPLLMSLTTFVYAAMALRHFLNHRIEFAAHLRSSHSAISPGRYFRLMSMAVVEMFWDTGINIYIIWFNVQTGIRPWTTWQDVHSNFSRVGVVPEFLIPPVALSQLIWQWWIIPISCFFFFIFFAFGEEAMSDYRAAFTWFRRTILRQTTAGSKPYNYPFVLPVHRSHHVPVDIDLPMTSRDGPQPELKAWDELSLKMPDIGDHIISSGSESNSTLVAAADSLSLTGTHILEMGSLNTAPQLLSLDKRRNSTSSHVSIPTPTNFAGPTRLPSTPAPVPTTSRPISEASSLSFNNTIHRPPPTLHRTSSSPSQRRSSSSSFDLSISDGYCSDSRQGLEYHEEGSFDTHTPFTKP